MGFGIKVSSDGLGIGSIGDQKGTWDIWGLVGVRFPKIKFLLGGPESKDLSFLVPGLRFRVLLRVPISVNWILPNGVLKLWV